MDSNILLSAQYVSGTGIYVFQCILPLDSGEDMYPYTLEYMYSSVSFPLILGRIEGRKRRRQRMR